MEASSSHGPKLIFRNVAERLRFIGFHESCKPKVASQLQLTVQQYCNLCWLK